MPQLAGPQIQKKMTKILEMVLHNGAKFATNQYPKKGKSDQFSISKILENLHWDSLEHRRIQARTTMVFKIINNHVILEPEMLPKASNSRPQRECNNFKVGFQNQLSEPQARLDVVSTTFFYATPKLWNSNISPHQASSKTVDKFKKYFKWETQNVHLKWGDTRQS